MANSKSDTEPLLQGVVDEPQAEDRWSVLADWLEEHDDPRRAELLRLHRRLLTTCCEPHKHPERAGWQARLVALLADGVKPCLPQKTIQLGQRLKIPMTFSWIGPGSFLMGSPPREEGRRDDETLHLVTLTRGFWMGVYPATQAQWRWAMRQNHSYFKGDDRPVEKVSWFDCDSFCQKLQEKTPRRFRLPTESEWEYAARAGTTTAYHTGDELATLKRTGWCSDDGEWRSAQQTQPVGQLLPNAWGLFDMHGNIFEWCADWYEVYPAADVIDPQGPNSGSWRLLRGGSWIDSPRACRSAFRKREQPNDGDGYFGCRLVLCPD